MILIKKKKESNVRTNTHIVANNNEFDCLSDITSLGYTVANNGGIQPTFSNQNVVEQSNIIRHNDNYSINAVPKSENLNDYFGLPRSNNLDNNQNHNNNHGDKHSQYTPEYLDKYTLKYTVKYAGPQPPLDASPEEQSKWMHIYRKYRHALYKKYMPHLFARNVNDNTNANDVNNVNDNNVNIGNISNRQQALSQSSYDKYHQFPPSMMYPPSNDPYFPNHNINVNNDNNNVQLHSKMAPLPSAMPTGMPPNSSTYPFINDNPYNNNEVGLFPHSHMHPQTYYHNMHSTHSPLVHHQPQPFSPPNVVKSNNLTMQSPQQYNYYDMQK